MLGAELFDAVGWEISVKCCSADFELIDDVTDEPGQTHEWEYSYKSMIFCI